MHRKTVVLGSAAAAAMLALSQVGASANMVWCISDPPLQVVTPAGHNVLINNMVYLPPYAMHLKSQVADGAVAVPMAKAGAWSSSTSRSRRASRRGMLSHRTTGSRSARKL